MRNGVVIFLFLSMSTTSFAQLHIGPIAGGNISWTSFNDKDFKDLFKVKPVAGYHVGLHSAFQVRKRFFLHTSILYSTKGKVIKGKVDERLKNTVRYNFVEMPIIYTVDFKGKFGKSGKEFKYFMGVGPNLSYWLGGKGEVYNIDLEEANMGTLSYRIKFNKTVDEVSVNEMSIAEPTRLQLGLNVQVGMDLEPNPGQRLIIALRYEMGHSNLSKKSNGLLSSTYYEDILQSRNQGLRLSVAYLFDTKVEKRKKGKSTIKRNRMS
jgi:hypothetical protein